MYFLQTKHLWKLILSFPFLYKNKSNAISSGLTPSKRTFNEACEIPL